MLAPGESLSSESFPSSATRCLDENVVAAYVDGTLSGTTRATVEEHAASCAPCRELLSTLARRGPTTDVVSDASPLDTELLSVGASPNSSSPFDGPADAPVAPGARLGRYVVQRHLASGGMGVVYVARDPELNRKVALKLVHDSKDTQTGRARLLREAQAMAKLSHPSVVSVYDVGTLGEQVFLALEYIEGGTLTAWLRKEPRGLAAILDVFTQAGRGLAAAHAEGIVHRDFKPDNVLVGAEGRARVTDFGLARTPEPAAPSASSSGETPTKLPGLLTRTGTMLGTPAYMAAEQHRGLVADARSDQFSFCVALYEAVCGARPFHGETYADLAVEVVSGRVPHPPPGARVPGWLLRILRRGLRPTPGERFSDMDALLAALAQGPARARRRTAVVLGAFAAAIAAAALWIGGRTFMSGEHADPLRAQLAGALAFDGAHEARGVAAASDDGNAVVTPPEPTSKPEEAAAPRSRAPRPTRARERLKPNGVMTPFD